MKNKKKIIIGSIIAVLLVIAFVFLFIKVIKPYNVAVKDYKSAVAVIDKKNVELDKSIDKVQKIIDENPKVIDETVINNAKKVAKEAGAKRLVVDKMPGKTSEIIKETKKLSKPLDYTEELKQLSEAYIAYDTSKKQYIQLTNPKEEFVIQRIKTVDEVVDARAVTEDNDPNGKLNKPGGYTSTVYFESSNVVQEDWMGTDLIDKGTTAGGAIEVYATEEDAIKRRDYLAGYDGSVLSNGSHTVVGTVLIRTSDELPASKQKALEEKIINALAKLD